MKILSFIQKQDENVSTLELYFLFARHYKCRSSESNSKERIGSADICHRADDEARLSLRSRLITHKTYTQCLRALTQQTVRSS